jgi:protein gp37
MSDNSTIEWTDATWNPIRGCTKISPGCAHCYAETFAERFRGVPGHPYEQGFDLRLVPEKLADPFRWPKPKMVFVNSMSDLFHRDVTDDYVQRVVRVMQTANWHTYQVLTKRSERLAEMLAGPLREAAAQRHIWWGVSVENREHGLPRIEHLKAAPAAMRFLSVEPLIEDLGPVDLAGIDWVIVGGESGPGARPLAKEWVLALRDLCQASRFSSSNGVACAKARPAGSSTAKPTTSAPPPRPIRSPRPPVARHSWPSSSASWRPVPNATAPRHREPGSRSGVWMGLECLRTDPQDS